MITFDDKDRDGQIQLTMDDAQPSPADIKVVGIGGGGGNAVSRMISAGVGGVHFIAANTDCQSLVPNPASSKVQLGAKLTTLSAEQSAYIDIPVDGPYKPDHYRY